MRNLVAAMQHGHVRRLVDLSAWGSGGVAVPPRIVVVRYFPPPILLRHSLADKRRGEAHLFSSNLAYTNVCPALIKDSGSHPPVRVHGALGESARGLEYELRKLYYANALALLRTPHAVTLDSSHVGRITP